MPEYQVYFDPESIDSDLKVTMEMMMERYFERLPIFDGLMKLSNIERYLFRQGSNETDVQLELLNKIFACPSDDPERERFELLVQVISRIVSKSTKPEVVLFHYKQLYFCMAAIIRHSKVQEGEITYKSIGIALLQINSLLNKASNNNKTTDSNPQNQFTLPNTHKKRNDVVVSSLWEAYQFSLVHSDKALLELARVHIIFYKTSTGKFFREEFLKSVGIELKTFWCICFTIFSGWLSSSNKPDFYTFALNQDAIKSLFPTESDAISNIFEILSADLEVMKKLDETKRNKRTEIEPDKNFLFLEEKPMLKRNEQYICLSLPYFINWVYSDIVSLTSLFLKARGKNLPGDFGGAYEEYVKLLLKKVYEIVSKGSKQVSRIHFVKSKGIEIADAILDYGDSLILIEVKAKLRRERMKSIEPEHIKNRLKALLEIKGHKGKPQLEKRIEEFRRGETHIPGINSASIKNYWPVIVTCRAEFPQCGELYRYYNQILQEEGCFQGEYFKPLTIIDLKELEVILELARKGHSFLYLLKERHNKENVNNTFRDLLSYKYSCKEPSDLLVAQKNIFNEVQNLMEDRLSNRNVN